MHDAGRPAPPPDPPELWEWVKRLLHWFVEETSRRAGGHPSSPWLDAKAAAAHTTISYETFRKIAKHVPRHRYSEQGWVYHRAELDAWLMADGNRYWEAQ
jgi:hypothetical protein